MVAASTLRNSKGKAVATTPLITDTAGRRRTRSQQAEEEEELQRDAYQSSGGTEAGPSRNPQDSPSVPYVPSSTEAEEAEQARILLDETLTRQARYDEFMKQKSLERRRKDRERQETRDKIARLEEQIRGLVADKAATLQPRQGPVPSSATQSQTQGPIADHGGIQQHSPPNQHTSPPFGGPDDLHTPPGSSDSESGEDISKLIKFEHDKLSTSFTYVKWKSWVDACEEIFAASGRKFRRDYTKVVFARNKLADSAKTMFRNRCAVVSREDRHRLQNSWEGFMAWTKSITKNSGHHEATTSNLLEHAAQRVNQDPREFDSYLVSLEEQLPADTEPARARLFYRKLLPQLQKQLSKFNTHLPLSRTNKVEEAVLRWELMTDDEKKTSRNLASKRDREDNDPPGPSKRARSNNSNNRSNSNPNNHANHQSQDTQGGGQNSRNRKGNRCESNGNQPRNPNSNGNGHPSSNKHASLTCYNCHKLGHISPNCPSKQAGSIARMDGQGMMNE